jgi:uracil phosphoribosyltransferase
MARMGEIFAYEISKTLDFIPANIPTSLGEASMSVLENHPVIACMLRSGLPLHQGMLNFFHKSSAIFLASQLKEVSNNDTETIIRVEHSSVPDIDNKILIITDAVIATGKSMYAAYKEMLAFGNPLKICCVSALATMEGISFLKSKLPSDSLSLWIGAVDDELTAQSLVVPGLGDASRLAYGD